MVVEIESQFKDICNEILLRGWSKEEWAERESDDELHAERYSGGYDADEEAFCFSYFAADGIEYWFQVTMEEIVDLSEGRKTTVDARVADV